VEGKEVKEVVEKEAEEEDEREAVRTRLPIPL